MSILSKCLTFISICQLLHAGYASSEFHHIIKGRLQNAEIASKLQLSLDVKLEVLMGLMFFVIGTFLSIGKIQLQSLHGEKKTVKLNQYLQDILLSKAAHVNNIVGTTSFDETLNTPNLINIQKKRGEYRKWMVQNLEK